MTIARRRRCDYDYLFLRGVDRDAGNKDILPGQTPRSLRPWMHCLPEKARDGRMSLEQRLLDAVEQRLLRPLD